MRTPEWRPQRLSINLTRCTKLDVFRQFYRISPTRGHSEDLAMSTKPTYEELERAVFELQKEVSKRAQAEKALRRSERMLNETQMLAKIGGWEYHVNEKRTTWTDEVYRIYGVHRCAYDPNDLNRNFSFYAPEDRKKIERAFRNAVSGGDSFDLELGFISAKGNHIWVRTIGNPIVENKKVAKVVGNLMDITDRKRANEMLLAERLKLERYFEHIPLMAYNFSFDGRIADCNSEAVKALGYDSKEALVGKPAISTLYTPESRERATRIFEKWKKGKRIKNKELKVITEGGEVIDVLLNMDTVFDQAGTPIHTIATHLDITEYNRARAEKEKLQSQLRQFHKMEAVATLAGGIAHDYNNLLSIIMGNLSLAVELAEPGSELGEFLTEANMASIKARDLTHGLMALSRGGAPVKEVGSLKGLLRSARDFIPDRCKISLEASIPEDLWPVPHDPHKMSAVFRNVVTNAVEAMPEGGALSIKAENLAIEGTNRNLRLTLKPVNHVHISIKDHGWGIPGKNIDKIFDPYFSTKSMGVQKGMGLGLATTYIIVEKHGGHIAVDSSPGTGTTVNIYLPVEPAENEAKSQEHAIDGSSSSLPRVLVMDDEEMLRKLARQMLKRLGYQAKTVKDGVEAIDAVLKQKKSGKPFDMVILDLTIKGGMGGKQTVQELLKIDPNIKTIVSSGYFNDPVISRFEEYGFMGSIIKPYKIDNLKETLEKLSN
jgi:PAS domain S-box-containing protein